MHIAGPLLREFVQAPATAGLKPLPSYVQMRNEVEHFVAHIVVALSVAHALAVEILVICFLLFVIFGIVLTI